MEIWAKFEQEALDYLKSLFPKQDYRFELVGGSDSTKPDILVYKNNKTLFAIEAKYSPSQSGQFVVLQDNKGVFRYSERNQYQLNRYSMQIIDYINDNRDVYSNVSQSNIDILCEKNVLYNWVVHHYFEKNSRFVITANELKSYKAIIKTEEIKKYFQVNAGLRRKKSGSRHLPLYRREEAKQNVKDYFAKMGVRVAGFQEEDDKTVVFVQEKVRLETKDRYFGNNMYLSDYASGSSGSSYFIKVLSETNNVNVIFNLEYTGPKSSIGVGYFTDYLNNF